VNTFIPDVSVAAKWVLPAAEERFIPEAFQLLESYTANEIRLLVPDIFWPEFGNVLWKAVRQGRQSRPSAEVAIASIRERGIATVPSLGLLPEALAIALDFGRTVYDSLYVALAITIKGEFITADQRLASALAAYLPVKWLGAL